MSIDLCFHIYRFQRRCHWVLSSLNQQINNPMSMRICIAAHKDDPFRADLNTMKKTFNNLDIHINEYTDDRFKQRGRTRTDNIKNCTSEWLLFLDGDNVFPTQFFLGIKPWLDNLKATDKRKVISVPRLTMAANSGYSLVDKNVDFTKEVPEAYNQASLKKTHPSFGGRVSAAGYFQLVHVPTMKQMGIDTYVNGSYDTSVLDPKKRYQTKSDIVFRKRFDGVLPLRTAPMIIHLNHFRRSLDGDYDFNKCN